MKTLIGPFDELVTMEDTIPKGALLVEDGIIQAIGLHSHMAKLADERIDIPGPSVALPGLIDAHAHLVYAGDRSEEYVLKLSGVSYQEIAKRGGGIRYTTEKTREASEEELLQGLLIRLQNRLRKGITTQEIKSGYGSELKMLEVIDRARALQPIDLISTCLAAHVVPPEFSSPSDYLKMVLEQLLPEVKKRNLAHRVDIFVEEGAFSLEVARDYLLQAKAMGFDLVIHGDQFTDGACALAAEVGALSIDHLEKTTPEGAALLREAGVIPIVLPGASLGLGLPFAPANMLFNEGLPVAIASDANPGSAPMGDLLTSAAILGAYEKLSMGETFAGITLNAARALGLSDRGDLIPGMRADVAIFPATKAQEILYHQGQMEPHTTIIQGKVVYAKR